MSDTPTTNKRKPTPKDTAASRKKKQQKLDTASKQEEPITMSPNDPDMTPDIDNTWVSASKTRNFMLKDPLLDWLAMYGEKKGFLPDTETDVQKSLNFGKFIMEKGIEFESYIVSLMKTKHTIDFHEVDGSHIIGGNRLHRQIKDTYTLMKKGAKIIYQGLLYNPVNKTWGYPDLIVRSDYLNEICDTRVISDEKSKKGCRFSKEWHYRIIDIKFATLKMKVDGKSLLNQGSILPYKAQTYIYNRALGHMQNLIPRKAYLLGRGWNTTKESVSKPFDKMGQVDFAGCDEEIGEDVKSAVEWVRSLRKFGEGWKVLPAPSNPELYPNMCNDSNNNWGSAKKKIAEELKEITSVWQCGVADREMCHGKRVYRWTDPKCTAELMGKGGKINPPMINKILEVNRGDDKYYIDKSSDDSTGWKRNDKIPSFFIDFETVSNINNVRTSDEDGNIFMIGSILDSTQQRKIQDEEKDSPEKLCPSDCKATSEMAKLLYEYCEPPQNDFSCFVSSRLTSRDEKKVIEDFLRYVETECVSRGESKCRVYHYSFAEPSSFKKAIQKYNISVPIEIEWVDLLAVVKKYSFVVKGAMDFSLKSIVDALSKNGMLDLSYTGSAIANGSNAMIAAFKSEDIAMKMGIPMMSTDIMKSVRDYNMIDCVVLQRFRDLLEKILS